MTPLDAATLVYAMALGFLWLIHRQIARLENEDPRTCGIVIVRERALDAHSPHSLGHYLGHEIWDTVTFRGLIYRFDHVLPRAKRERIAPGELFLDPGLVYVLRVAA